MRTEAKVTFLVYKVLVQLAIHWFIPDKSDIGLVNPQTFLLWMYQLSRLKKSSN